MVQINILIFGIYIMEAIYKAVLENRKLHILMFDGKMPSSFCKEMKLNGKKVDTITIQELDKALSSDEIDEEEKIRLMKRICASCLRNV